MVRYFRFTIRGVGIFEAVSHQCPKEDERRANKPNGSWLSKKGPDFEGCKSYFTIEGLKKYIESGLLNWHRSIVGSNILVDVIEDPLQIVYRDELQIICPPSQKVLKAYELKEFLNKFINF